MGGSDVGCTDIETDLGGGGWADARKWAMCAWGKLDRRNVCQSGAARPSEGNGGAGRDYGETGQQVAGIGMGQTKISPREL